MKHPFLEIGTKILPISGIILILFLTSFRFIQNFNNLLTGKWDVNWTIKGSDLSTTNNNMKGRMVFHKNGIVNIEANGYPGCIFSSDTIKNELMWKVNNDSLYLYNQTDQFKLSYFIQKASDKTIELKLLDDIFLTLKR